MISRALPKCPTNEEIDRFLSVIKNPTHLMMIDFARYMGLRASEVCRVRTEDIDLINKLLTIPHQKNKNNYEKIPIPSFLFNKICSYMRSKKITKGWLFPAKKSSHSNPHFLPVAIRTFMMRYRGLSGLTETYNIKRNGQKCYRFSFHSFRHWFGTYCYDKTKDLRATQLMMRHSCISSTMCYMHTSLSQKQEICNDIWTDQDVERITHDPIVMNNCMSG